VRRPWINFESGSGWTRRLPVIPICYKGLTKNQLPDPLGIFHALELTDSNAFHELIEEIATKFSIKVPGDFNPSLMFKNLGPKKTTNANGIGIVRTHQQELWENYF
jgi:hypothetical protein